MSSLERASPAGDRQAGPQQADLLPPNLSSMLIINPTYSALPVSLHHKLTFLFFSLPLPPFCPSLPLSFHSPSFFPPLLFSLLQQSYSRESYWRWGVWEKQELLPGAGRASHGRHESAERCSTEPIFFPSYHFLCLSLSHIVTVFSLIELRLSPGLFVSSLPASFTWTFTLLYLLHGTGAYSPPSSFYFSTAAHPRTLYLKAMLSYYT